MGFENLPKELVAKIQKLLKLQDGASTVEEAANAGMKVRDMLMKYNLDLQQVKDAGDLTTKEEPIVKPMFDTSDLTRKSEGGWIRKLADNIALANMCSVIGTGYSIGKIYIIGTSSNAELVWLMVTDLSERIRAMEKEQWSKYKGGEKRGTYRRGYFLGTVDGIAGQMRLKIEEERKQASIAETLDRSTLSESLSTALAITKMDAVMKVKVKSFIYESFPNLRSASGAKSSSLSGRAQGVKDGSSMHLGSTSVGQRRLN